MYSRWAGAAYDGRTAKAEDVPVGWVSEPDRYTIPSPSAQKAGSPVWYTDWSDCHPFSSVSGCQEQPPAWAAGPTLATPMASASAAAASRTRRPALTGPLKSANRMCFPDLVAENP